MRQAVLGIVFIFIGLSSSIKAQFLSKMFREFAVGIGTHYGTVYIDNPYIDMSNYTGFQFGLQTASVYKLHLYSEVKYTQTQIITQQNPLKIDDYDYPYTDYLKTISIPLFLGFQTEQYNYNSYYLRAGVAPVFHQKRGSIVEFDTNRPFYYGVQLGTNYDFMNHLIASVTFQYEAHPILYKESTKTANFLGIQLQLNYKY